MSEVSVGACYAAMVAQVTHKVCALTHSETDPGRHAGITDRELPFPQDINFPGMQYFGHGLVSRKCNFQDIVGFERQRCGFTNSLTMSAGSILLYYV